jgi:hypothetical protein
LGSSQPIRILLNKGGLVLWGGERVSA